MRVGLGLDLGFGLGLGLGFGLGLGPRLGLEQRREDRGEYRHRTIHEADHLRRVEDGVRGAGPHGAPLGDAAAGGDGCVPVRRGAVDSERASAWCTREAARGGF